MLEPFDYDIWLSTPPEEQEEKFDPDEYIFSGGRWVYVGDDV